MSFTYIKIRLDPTLCFGTKPSVLRQIECNTAEYIHSPQPAGSKTCTTDFIIPSLLCRKVLTYMYCFGVLLNT